MKSWNEIRKAATAFSKRWKNAYDEKAQSQSFLKEFFAVFGVDTVVFNAFEHRVKFTDGSQGYADCFWQGKILVEMKSAGKDLDTAYQQAMEYVRTLPPADYPHVVVVSDFQRFRFYNLEKDNALTANTYLHSSLKATFNAMPPCAKGDDLVSYLHCDSTSA